MVRFARWTWPAAKQHSFAMADAPTASIVLPIYNQGDHIQDIVSSYSAALVKLPFSFELVLVPNNCRDNSVEVATRIAAEDDRVRVQVEERGGWGLAVNAGLRAARGEMLCYTNSARTTSEMLVLMLSYANAYPDVALKASRRIRDSVVRRAGSVLYNFEARALFNLPTWDINGTPKVFPRNFGRLLELRRDDDLIDLEWNIVCQREDYKMVEVPILETPRHGGSSTTNYRSALRMYLGALQLKREFDTAGG